MVLRYYIISVVLAFSGIISYYIPESSDPLYKQSTASFYLKKQGLIFEYQDTVSAPQGAIPGLKSRLFTTDLVIQVGAFHHEPYAKLLKDRISSLLTQTVVIVTEDDFHKVRIIKFANMEELEKVVPALGLMGIKSMWIFRDNKDEDIEPQPVVQSDTAVNPVEEQPELPAIVEDKPVLTDPELVLQVGIFHKKSQAQRAQKRISSNLNLPVEIIEEWDYFKVIIKGFKQIEDMYEYYPKLIDLGYPITNMDENNSDKKK